MAHTHVLDSFRLDGKIALVTGAIIVWFGSSVVGTALDVTRDLGWQLFSRIISIAGAAVILMAYKPPRWVREKYGVQGVEDPRVAHKQAKG